MSLWSGITLARVLPAVNQGEGRKITVLHWPRALVISFKRFAWDAQRRRHDKLNRHITFGLTLQPASRVSYRLSGVVVHTGNAYGGHYTAYTRTGDTWCFHDDRAAPTRVDTARVLAQQAYMSNALYNP